MVFKPLTFFGVNNTPSSKILFKTEKRLADLYMFIVILLTELVKATFYHLILYSVLLFLIITIKIAFKYRGYPFFSNQTRLKVFFCYRQEKLCARLSILAAMFHSNRGDSKNIMIFFSFAIDIYASL